MSEAKLTKKQRRMQRKLDKTKPNSGLRLNTIKPLTENQNKTFNSFYNDQHLFLHGLAGTGKTLLSLYLGLEQVLSGLTEQEKIIIVRSVVPTRDMGFLPGNSKEKAREYEAPYMSICNELFGRGDAYCILKSKNIIDFVSTSFIRGITWNNAIIIVDECQNLTSHEANSIITRVGQKCRIIFAGDIRQSDLNKKYDSSGLYDFIKIIRTMNQFDFIEFGVKDICRSTLVRDYIIARENLERKNEIEKLSKF